ncbi:hypothetical protein D3C78_1394560 [compost metagenome]
MAQRVALARLVGGQIGQRQRARGRGVGLHGLHDGLGRGAFVQGTRAVRGDVAQHMGQFGVLQQMADRPGLALGIVEIRARNGVAGQQLVVVQQGVQPVADGEASLGQRDRGLEQLGPGQAAVRAVGLFEHAHRARHTDRAAAGCGLVESQGLAVGLEE